MKMNSIKYIKNINIIKRIIFVIIFFIFSLNIYSINDYISNDTTICIVINKDDINKIKNELKDYNIIYIDNKHIQTLQFVSVDNDLKSKNNKNYLKEFKISIGIGGTYGILNKKFDFGPSINIGYEFTF